MKNVIKGWVGRDKDGRLFLYTDKPWKCAGRSWTTSKGEWIEIDKSWYPSVKWEDEEPTETAFATIDESELTHGKVAKMEEAPDDRTYCKEHCKGYRESGGKCYFGFNCSAKKESETEKKWAPKFKKGDYITDMDNIYIIRKADEDGYWCAICDDDCNPKEDRADFFSHEAEKNLKLYKREPEEKQTIEISSTKEAEAEKKWIPKFKAGDLFTYNDTSNETKLYTVKRLEQHGCVAGYWCEQFDAPTKGNLWFCSSEEKYMMEPEPEEKQTMEIKSTKEAEEIINFIKDCFNRCRIAFPDADWGLYEAALEVLRPEYSSYQQGFNAGYEEGYLSRKRVEKEFVEEIKGYLDELKDVKID